MSAPYLFSKYALPSPPSPPSPSQPEPLAEPHFLVRRVIDPIFAMSIGITAAGVRINREEKEKGRSTQESFEGLKRRWGLAMESSGLVGGGEGKDGGKKEG